MSNRTLRRTAWIALALLASGAAASWLMKQQAERALVARGQALFDGQAPLTGRIVGHDLVLPTTVSRCANCHDTRSPVRSAAASAAAGRYAPALQGDSLLQLVSRRGGKPSRYDAAALCGLLRSGVDPAFVVVPQTMPRYEIETADCESLWRYLLTR